MDKLMLQALVRQAEAELRFAERTGDRRGAKSIKGCIKSYKKQLQVR